MLSAKNCDTAFPDYKKVQGTKSFLKVIFVKVQLTKAEAMTADQNSKLPCELWVAEVIFLV